jgi:ElaB/YqjD/DUF883 family membrane-anchored ribosome-binding protein
MTTNTTTISPIARDFQNMIDDTQQLPKTVENEGEAKVNQARTQLNESLSAARATFGELVAQVQEGAKRTGMQADEYVHSHPWQVVGMSAAVGAMVGFVIARR